MKRAHAFTSACPPQYAGSMPVSPEKTTRSDSPPTRVSSRRIVVKPRMAPPAPSRSSSTHCFSSRSRRKSRSLTRA